MKNFLLSIILVLLLCNQSLAGSSVWKVEKDASVMFLAGTFHILRPSDFPLPPAFNTAYKASDLLVFETDLGKFNDHQVQQKLLARARYADGTTVDKHLSPKTYRMLKEYCAANGISLANLSQFKPSIIAVTMATMELAKLGATPEGVDAFFYQLATKDKKAIEGLETINEQIDFIIGMGEGNEDALITHSIEDLKSIKQDYTFMVEAWKKGDVKKLHAFIVADLKIKMPKLYQTILIDRNRNWLPQLEAYLKTAQKEFILVGV
ncbi:MAG: TraB/GumN family protein, partial [Candidatus Electrothrix sp. AR3]|nr:TraB/GumN family protein [Candidatus Electrothrix sp. AR3]